MKREARYTVAERDQRWRTASGEEKNGFESGAAATSGYSVKEMGAGPCVAGLLHTTALQRLHAITQLGFVARVWPQATHTRYEHSLGCYHLAKRVVAHLQALHPCRQSPLFTREQIRTFGVAALLHDIGHYPFSHSLDSLRSLLPSHERVGRMLIEQSALATILERDYHLVPTRVADFIDPPFQRAEARGSDALLYQLLNGPCDIDKLEYVARDAQACGLSCRAVCAPSTILNAFHVCALSAQRTLHLALASPILPILRTWIYIRHFLYLQVYWHGTNRTGAAMLSRAVQDALEAEALTVTQLQQTDDAGLLALLAVPGMPQSTRMLTHFLSANHLYQPVWEISHQATSLSEPLHRLAQDASQRKWLEQQLACQLTQHLHTNIAEHELLLDYVPAKQWDLDGWIFYQAPPVGMVSCVPWSHALGFSSADLAHAAQNFRHMRVLIAPQFAPLLQGRAGDVVLPLLEHILANMR